MGADILWCLGMVEWVLQHAHGKLVNSNSEVQLGDKCVVEYKVIGGTLWRHNSSKCECASRDLKLCICE